MAGVRATATCASNHSWDVEIEDVVVDGIHVGVNLDPGLCPVCQERATVVKEESPFSTRPKFA